MRAKKRWAKKKKPRPRHRDARSEANQRLLNRVRARALQSHANAPSPSAIPLFTANSNPTAIGLRPEITVTCFTRAKQRVRAVGGRTQMVAGFTATRVGLGFRKNRLAGPPIITGVGRVCAESAGFGFRAINGRQLGFLGARAAITSAGRRCLPKRDSIN